MSMFYVTWEIVIGAPTAYEAALKALGYQRDPAGTATVFDVKEMDCEADAVRIDLLAPQSENK